MKASSIGYSKSKYSYPVVELFGLGSASFISGTPPLSIQQTDLRSTVAPQEANKQISEVISAFMTDDAASHQVLDKYIDATDNDVSPYLEMLRIEDNPFISSFGNHVELVDRA